MFAVTGSLALCLAAVAGGQVSPQLVSDNALTARPDTASLIRPNWPADSQVQPKSAWQESPLASPPVRLPPLDSIEAASPLNSPPGADAWAESEFFEQKKPANLWYEIWQDHLQFYSWQTLIPTLGMFGMGAVLANTDLDQETYEWWQRDIHSQSLFNAAIAVRNFGEGTLVVPAIAGLWLTGEVLGDAPGGEVLARWAGRSARSMIIGAPALLVLQMATGGSRPLDSLDYAQPSHWKFFEDDNGVSGHAFLGAIPFLTAAQLVENPWAKGTLMAGSTLVAVSRMETGAHYLSQVMLGWWLAYMATNAIERTSALGAPYQVEPMLMRDGFGMAISWRR